MIIRNRMNEHERKVLLKLWNGDNRTLPILHSLCEIHHKRVPEVFYYMIKKGITGRNFYEFSERSGFLPWRIVEKITRQIDGLMAEPMVKADFN